LIACSEAGVVSEQLLVGVADRVDACGDLSCRQGENGIGLVQRDETFYVASVGALKEELSRLRSSGLAARSR